MIHRISVPADAGWLNTGIVVPPGVPVHICASRMYVTGGAPGTDAPLAYDIEHPDSGGIYPVGNRLGYPEGSYGNNSRTMAVGQLPLMTVDPRGVLKGVLMATSFLPFCLVGAFSSTNPGPGFGGGFAVNRRYTASSGAGGTLWLAINDYSNCQLGSNSGFLDVIVGWPEEGQAMASGSLPWNTYGYVGTGLSASGHFARVACTGLGRYNDQFWIHPEGTYGNAYESNPTYSPLAVVGTHINPVEIPPGGSKPYEVRVMTGVPVNSDPGLNVDRDVAYTPEVFGSGAVSIKVNVRTQDTQYMGGSVQWIVELTESGGGGGGGPLSGWSLGIRGSYDVRRGGGARRPHGSKGL